MCAEPYTSPHGDGQVAPAWPARILETFPSLDPQKTKKRPWGKKKSPNPNLAKRLSQTGRKTGQTFSQTSSI